MIIYTKPIVKKSTARTTMNTGSTVTIESPNDVAAELAHVVHVPTEEPPTEAEEDEGDDEGSLASLYSCSYCHSFGMEGCPCGRCGEDAGSYYVGEKMTEEKIEEAVRLMREEDENEASEDESEEDDDN